MPKNRKIFPLRAKKRKIFPYRAKNTKFFLIGQKNAKFFPIGQKNAKFFPIGQKNTKFFLIGQHFSHISCRPSAGLPSLPAAESFIFPHFELTKESHILNEFPLLYSHISIYFPTFHESCIMNPSSI
jgi:hypothetical protein